MEIVMVDLTEGHRPGQSRKKNWTKRKKVSDRKNTKFDGVLAIIKDVLLI